MNTNMSYIEKRYHCALDKFIEKAKSYSNIIAAVSYGSVVYGGLWEKSDIDMWLISKENSKKVYKQYSLVEDDIDFQVELYSRNYFIELVDSHQNQNFFRNVINQSKLLFSADETIEKLFNQEKLLGDRDKEENLLKAAIYAIISIIKKEKDNLYILDEPTTGLHIKDIEKLLLSLNELVDLGNTVVVIEHNLDLIKTADYIIDMGPDAGENGGQIVAEGTPEDVIMCDESYTGKYLRKYMK